MIKDLVSNDCRCSKPEITQDIPTGFKGKIQCKRCKGLFDFPLQERKYQGNDPVEAFLYYSQKNDVINDPLTAVVTMLLRIEKKLCEIAPIVEAKKNSDHANAKNPKKDK